VNKEALKNLREARKSTILAVAARLKEQQKAVAALKAELAQGERTVPELAAATGLPSATVLWYVAALKKYGEVAEGAAGKPEGGYFRYRLAADDDQK
jgi:predicted transcriptional regulator